MTFAKIKESLPIDRHKRSILYSLERHQILIIVGETGSGKSTRIPQFLFSAGIYNEDDADNQVSKKPKVICITQPRRVAAVQLAQRVSQDLNCELGSTVGYAIRFKDVTSEEQTMIKFLTEGLLIREMMADPILSRYSVIMIDEVHERNLNTDILLGLLKCILRKRKDLKLIICSATMDVNSLVGFFTETSETGQSTKPGVLKVEGKTYPVKIYYKKDSVANYLDAAADTVMRIHESSRLASGKVLVFLTGLDEVEYVCDKLQDYAQIASTRLELKKLVVIPLHASLKPDEISQVFEEPSKNARVCIVSTNVAETSLTIKDVAFVVDCGFAKMKIFDHSTGVDSLVRVPVSKSSAMQRAGRAGRTRDGQVYRLYRESDYKGLEDNTAPEIQRSSLTETIMLLKSLGVDNIQLFPLISPMPLNNLVVSLELLHILGAIDESGQLTSAGEVMAQFNLDPKISKILTSPASTHCIKEVCRIAAMLQMKEIFQKPGRSTRSLWANTNLANLCVSEGDILSYLNIVNGFNNNQRNRRWAEKRNLNYQVLLNALEVSDKLEKQLNRCGIRAQPSTARLELIQKSIVAGLFANAAYLHPCGDYKTIRGDRTVFVHPNSVYNEMIERPKYVVFGEILNTTKSYMRHIMAVERSWLLEAAPHFYTFATNIEMMRNKLL